MENPKPKTIPIQLGDQSHELRYTLRAFKSLGFNPFQKDSVAKFMEEFSPDAAAEFIRAGLLHEYRPGATRAGQEPPTADDLLDLVDMTLFNSVMAVAMGTGDKEAGDDRADPQAA